MMIKKIKQTTKLVLFMCSDITAPIRNYFPDPELSIDNNKNFV